MNTTSGAQMAAPAGRQHPARAAAEYSCWLLASMLQLALAPCRTSLWLVHFVWHVAGVTHSQKLNAADKSEQAQKQSGTRTPRAVLQKQRRNKKNTRQIHDTIGDARVREGCGEMPPPVGGARPCSPASQLLN